MLELYKIEGTSNAPFGIVLNGPEHNDPTFYPNFKKDFYWLKMVLLEKNKKKEGFVVMRVYDGEIHFLRKERCKNGPRRHYSASLTDEFIKPFKEGCYKVDVLASQLNRYYLRGFNSAIPSPRPKFTPMGIIYGLLANKWLLSAFKNRIALIGGSGKMEVIKRLMLHREYREYVRNDYFLDYIAVPERFSCDDTKSLSRTVGDRIRKSRAEVFLFGIGISKLAVAHTFKKYKNAVFIDIGCGMSGLAGTVEIARPYFGSWTNYRIRGYDYSNIDPTNFNPAVDNVRLLPAGVTDVRMITG